MSDIFISYSSKDRTKTRALVKVLESKGWSVWWDKNIPPGERFIKAINEALDNAKCIVVLWSENSIKSDWVFEEALEGKNRKILIPAKIDSVEIPFGFRVNHTVNLSRWSRGSSAASIQELIKAIEKLAKVPVASTGSKKVASPKLIKRKITGGLDGKKIAIAGRLSENQQVNREKMELVGASFTNTVSATTDFLVIGTKTTTKETKRQAAKEHSVPEISEQEWLKLLNKMYSQILKGKTIVFTGALHHKRSELESLVKKHGAKPTGNISSKTDFLVVGKNPSDIKLQNARKFNTRIIDEHLWYEIITTLDKRFSLPEESQPDRQESITRGQPRRFWQKIFGTRA